MDEPNPYRYPGPYWPYGGVTPMSKGSTRRPEGVLRSWDAGWVRIFGMTQAEWLAKQKAQQEAEARLLAEQEGS